MSAVLHPKTAGLGLTGEKVLGLSACNIRASVFTESGKVREARLLMGRPELSTLDIELDK